VLNDGDLSKDGKMKRNYLLSVLALSLLILGCNPPNTPSGAERVDVENGEDLSQGRVDLVENDEIFVESFDLSKRTVTDTEMPGRLFLRAKISLPDFEGENLHANHVTVNEDYAYVSYSTVNETYRGGVEVIDIEDIRHPRIKSRLLYRDTDVTIARKAGARLFIGGAIDSDNSRDFETPALLEVIELEGRKVTGRSRQYDLPSFNANDILVDENKIYVTSGSSEGTLSVFSSSDLSLIGSVSLPGAKAITKYSGELLVMEGTGTGLYYIDPQTRSIGRSVALGCPNYFQAKAELAISGMRLYASAWDCGLLVVDLESGVVVDQVELPAGVYCNSVSIVDDRWVFLANGNDGLWLLEIKEDGLRKIGRVRMEGSTNYITVSGNKLLIANGKAGVLMVEITPFI
jgi:hypothetical protein